MNCRDCDKNLNQQNGLKLCDDCRNKLYKKGNNNGENEGE